MVEKNTMLVVDDLEMNRAILGNIFKKNYNIVEVSDGDEALEYIRKNSNKLSAILLDLVMPKMNGIKVLEILRKEKLADEVPIFIITADNSEEVMYKAYELGVKDILEKPFVPYFLKKRIERVIELCTIRKNQSELLDGKIEKIKDLNEIINDIFPLMMELKTSQDKKRIVKEKRIIKKLLSTLHKLKYEEVAQLNSKEMEEIVNSIEIYRMLTSTDEGVRVLERLAKMQESSSRYRYAYDMYRYQLDGLNEQLKISIWVEIIELLTKYDEAINSEEEKINSLDRENIGVVEKNFLEILRG